MESDSDYEVEEETLVHVEAAGVLQEDICLSSPPILRFIQVDSTNPATSTANSVEHQPLIQVGNQVFTGTYQDTVGTSLFFRQTELSGTETDSTDAVFGRSINSRVEYLDCTRKKLQLKRVFLKPNRPTTSTTETARSSSNVNNDDISATTAVTTDATTVEGDQIAAAPPPASSSSSSTAECL